MSLFSSTFRPSLTDDLTLSRNTTMHNFVRQWITCAGLCLLLSCLMLFAITAVAVVRLAPKPHIPSTEAAEYPDIPRFVQSITTCKIAAPDNKEVM